MNEVVCAACEGPLENPEWCDPQHQWTCTACEQADYALYLAGIECECGKSKTSGESMCHTCAHCETVWAGIDHEEEDRQARLMACLPDGDYTTSELRDYLS